MKHFAAIPTGVLMRAFFANMTFRWNFHLSEQSCIWMKRSKRNSVVLQALEASQLYSAGKICLPMAAAVKDGAAQKYRGERKRQK